jgi:hypothetical protein
VPLLGAGAVRLTTASAEQATMSEPGGNGLHLLAGTDTAAPPAGPAQDPAPLARQGFGWHVKAIAAAAGLLAALAAAAAAGIFLTFPQAARVSHLSQRDVNWLVPVGALAAVITAAVAWRAVQRLFRNHPAEDIATVVGAILATGTSATGMWTFFVTFVPTLPPALRVLFFAFLEIFTLAEGLRARRNMREFKSAGVDGTAMWAGAAISAFLSCLASTTIAEALFRLVPPLLAAWMWERTLVAERRRTHQRRPSQIQWRIRPERILVRLNLAEPTGRTLGDVAAQRRITLVALAAERAASLDAAGGSARRRGRADRRLRTTLRLAVEHADLATDEERQRQLLSQLAALRGYQSLTTLTPAPPWELLDGDRPAGGSGEPDRPGPAADGGVYLPASALASFTEALQELRALIQNPAASGSAGPASGSAGGAAGGSAGGRSAGGAAGGSAGGRSAGGAPRDHHDEAEGTEHPDADVTERVEALARALRQADGADIHALLAGRDDYTVLARAAASQGKPKRLLALIGLYATRQLTSNAAAAQWIAEHVEGPAGQVDKNEVRQVRRIIEPVWADQHYPAQSREMEAR